jgi:hypothetical protein
VRIERLWVDITAQVGAHWHERFTLLELQCGLDINNTHHIWLLHYLFLTIINDELTFFAQAWNQHRLQIRNGPNRSPMDMFVFDTLVHGVRSTPLDENLSPEELEVYGVDWEGLQDEAILHSRDSNNVQDEAGTSWVGRVGPPSDLGGVILDEPNVQLEDNELAQFHEMIDWSGGVEIEDVARRWMSGLVAARHVFGAEF